MKSSIKPIRKFGKVIVIETAKDFDDVSVDYALNERTLGRIEAKMNAEIERVKEKYRPQIEYHLDARVKMTPPLIAWAKALWNGIASQQIFNYITIVWKVHRDSLKFVESEEKTIAALKSLGLTDLIRVAEEVKKNEFKSRFGKEPDLMLNTFAAKIDKDAPEFAGVEVNWEKASTTLDAEIAVKKRSAA